VRTRVRPCSLLLILLCAAGACAEPSSPAAASATPTTASRASPRVVEAVRTATTRAAGKTERVPAPGGGQLERVTLGEGYQHVVVGRLEADGTVSTSCVDSAPQAEAFLSGGRRADVQ
jgi:hypothetical protein